MPITEGGRFTPNNRIVSPGVFTRENDLSGIAQGVADIGAVIVAPFPKGPGFSPTLVQSVSELEAKFGAADGVFYGPYTAKDYLSEKGFVTVCRVGALTGYHQKYPFVIWAEQGTWRRNPETASIVPASSPVTQTDLTFRTSAHNQNGLTASYTGSIQFSNTPVTLTLGSSSLYNGTAVTGYINGYWNFTGSLNNFSTASATSASIYTALFAQGKFTGSSATLTFTSSTEPFNTAYLLNSFLTQSAGSCNNYVLNMSGSISGSIGNYTGDFITGSNLSYDVCTGEWTGSAGQVKVLAVLADTQNATINASLEAPGFNSVSSSMVSASNMVTAQTPQTLFNLVLAPTDSSTAYGTYQFSLDSTSTKYIKNVFGNDPTAGDPDNYVTGTKREAAYIYSIFENDIDTVVADKTHWRIVGAALPSGSVTGEALKFTDEYSTDLTAGDSEYSLTNAYTPWVLSQAVAPVDGGDSHRFPLFRFATLADGTDMNTAYKVEISNVKLAGTVAGSDWGTFTLSLRKFSDTDKKPNILEQWNNLSLDPDSPNYIARRIGDRYTYIRFDGKIIEFGDYENLSNYIRVEMTENPYPVSAVPYGFEAYATPLAGAMGHWVNPMAYTKASVYGLNPGKYPSGVDFDGAPTGADSELAALYPSASSGVEHCNDNVQYFAPIPANAGDGANTIFALDEAITANGVSTGSLYSTNSIPAVYDAANETTYVKMRKFVFGFQGGFDGQSPAIPINSGTDITAGNTQGLNCSTSTAAGSIAYNQCIGALGNADEFDINLIATPGIIYALHSYVTNLVIDMCETRGDCFYIMDIYQDDGNPTSGQIDEVVNLAAEFDTSYAGTYYPWLKIKDTNTNRLITVPPSVVLPGVYAANDRVAGEWWAIGGLTRGGITQAKQVTDRTTHTERDALYEGRVNPIAAFPGQGICVWGQKTLQVEASALDRINVRRLLIEIKKFFASTARYLVFEQNTAQTRNKFLAIVNPYLEGIQQRSGLYAFQVVMDESNNTPDLVDRNILYGQIYLKPTKAAEFIVLDFNVLPTGAAFPNA
jgi:hypothetical protein